MRGLFWRFLNFGICHGGVLLAWLAFVARQEVFAGDQVRAQGCLPHLSRFESGDMKRMIRRQRISLIAMYCLPTK